MTHDFTRVFTSLLQDLSFFLKLKPKRTSPVFFQQVYRRMQVRTCPNIRLFSLGRLSGVFTGLAAIYNIDYQTDKVQPPGLTSHMELQAWVGPTPP